MLVSISMHVLEQMEKTALLDLIGRENVYLAEPKFTPSLDKALVAANQWLIDFSFTRRRITIGCRLISHDRPFKLWRWE